MLKILLLSLSRQYTVDGQYIPSLFIEPEVRHDKTSYLHWKVLARKWSNIYDMVCKYLPILPRYHLITAGIMLWQQSICI